MKNRLFTIILMLFLSVGILSAAALAAPTAGGTGLSPDDPMVVPPEGMLIKGTTYYGISKTWFEEINPDKATMYFSVKVPDSVTSIIKDGFRDSYTNDKERNGAVTYHDDLGRYNMVAIDFSDATSLTTINSQAAMSCSYLSGVLDLSNTNITTLGKSAFSGCTGLTGVILPDTLEVLGAADGSAGSVFNGCTGLQFVRTARSDEDAVFELPSGLKVIGNQTFQSTFPKGANLKIQIPASVETIGSQAFYSNSAFSQIYINRESDFSGYNKDAFKANSSADCLVIFSNALAYLDFGKAPTRATRTFPVHLYFTENGNDVRTDYKLFGQSIQYTLNQNDIWEIDDGYVLPPISDSSTVPGYDSGWRLPEGKEILTNTSKVSGTASVDEKSGQGYMVVTVDNNTVISKPTVEYSVNGSVVQYAGTGVPQLEVAVGPGSPGSVGVQVTHPLATEEAKKSGTYVYFEYCWWDEMDDGVNGPRSETEPGLFSTSTTSSSYNRVFTGKNEIPIRSSADARTDGDYYMVEIFGYYVKDGGPPQRYYKSSHNFIGASDTATDKRSYVMNVIATDAVTVAIVPADITVYVGGSGYVGAVDGDGEPLGEDNGFPVPGFTISAEGLGNFDPAEAVLTYQNGGISYSWDIVPYDGVEGALHGIYRFEPHEDSNTPVRMRFFDESLDDYVDSDSFDIVGSLGKDLLMEVYGESIEMGYVKLVYDRVEYAVTTENGTLKVRSTTESEVYGSVVEREMDVPRGEPGVVVPDGAKYYINNKPVEVVDTSGVKLLFDDIIEQNSASVSNTQLLINRADEVLGGSSDSRRYEAKYLDLVDTSNGNAWAAADGAVTVYWPLPAGTDSAQIALQAILKFLQGALFGLAMAGLLAKTGSFMLIVAVHTSYDLLFFLPWAISAGTFPSTYLTGLPIDTLALCANCVCLVPSAIVGIRQLVCGGAVQRRMG